MVQSICQEIVLQKKYFPSDFVSDSIYFGGGTPSILSIAELEQILNTLYKDYKLHDDLELTLEGNPDDLSLGKIQELHALGFNRLSVGVQSFQDSFLKWMNRAHSSDQARQVMQDIRKVGFKNFTIDLMYGIPAEDHKMWEADLLQLLAFDPPHISAYCLTIEPKTVFGVRSKKGLFSEVEDAFSAQQFDFLVQKLTQNGYDAYEISNFAKPHFYSRHNSNYWKKGIYLGVGPGAHSYDGISRQYNISNNHRYMFAIEKQQIPAEKEYLTRQNHINEYLMTGLRTKWGCDLNTLKKYNFNIFETRSHVLQKYTASAMIELVENHLRLTHKGKFIADSIIADFFV